MKALCLIASSVAIGAALAPPPDPGWTLVISGDADGYLSPCGCTKPQTGGVRRRGTAVQKLAPHARLVYLDTGGLGGALGRQGELKAETGAQIAARLDAAALHVTERDAAFGPGVVASIARLASGRAVSTSLTPGTVDGIAPYRSRGPFLIGGVSAEPRRLEQAVGNRVREPDAAARELVAAARIQRKRAVLMFTGDRRAAEELAKSVPGIDVLVYRSGGDAPTSALKVGTTWLVTPGERGKSVVRLTLADERWGGYAAFRLGPGYADDPGVSRLYAGYLRRVDGANLLDQLPRQPSASFAGSAACGKCHVTATKVWQASAHAHALATLEKDGHARDPDCVSCHVVGLDRQGGFRSRASTPTLANVGCESCHGPARAHAERPTEVRLPSAGERSCRSCHTPEQSPKFKFLTHWSKIRH